MKPLRRTVLIALSCLGSFAEPAWSNTSQTYEFKVFLGDQEIGRQRFDVSSDGKLTHVRVNAQFEVKFFYIPFYQYRHTNTERWEHTCLREIRSQTDDNGDAYFVNGNTEDGRLRVQTQNGSWSADSCIKTFAYWDPESIEGEQLLNSQTGELLPVSVVSLGEETISVQGVPTRTNRRRIRTSEFTVDLWYAEGGRWVALQSTTKKGDPLRYVLQ